MSDIDYVRKKAEEDFRLNQQTQMANEQAIRDSNAREAYNASLHQQRQKEEQERRN